MRVTLFNLIYIIGLIFGTHVNYRMFYISDWSVTCTYIGCDVVIINDCITINGVLLMIMKYYW